MPAQAKITDFFASPSNQRETSIKSLPKKLNHQREERDVEIVLDFDQEEMVPSRGLESSKSDGFAPFPILLISDDDNTDVDERLGISGCDDNDSKVMARCPGDRKNNLQNNDSISDRAGTSSKKQIRLKKHKSTSDTKTPKTKRSKLKAKNNENSESGDENVMLEDGLIGMKVRSPNG